MTHTPHLHGMDCSPDWPSTYNPISFSLCMLKLQVCVLTPSADIVKNTYNREDANQEAEDPGSLSPVVPSKLSLESDRGHSGGLLSPNAAAETRTFACPECWPGLLGQLGLQPPAARAGSVPGMIYSSTHFLLFGFCCGFSFSLAFSRVNAVLIFDLLLTVLTA